MSPSEVPVVALCGGIGLVIPPVMERRNKALVQVDHELLCIRVVRHYLRAGFRQFHFATGFQGAAVESELRAALPRLRDEFGAGVGFYFHQGEESATTAERLWPVLKEIGTRSKYAAVTYTDTLTSLDLAEAFKFHLRSKKLASLTAVKLPTRFRVLGLRPGETLVRAFAKETVISEEFVNGGFYFLTLNGFLDVHIGQTSKVFEEDVLQSLVDRQQLEVFVHKGAWQPLDSERDMKGLTAIARAGD